MHFHDIFLKYTFILITWYGNVGGTRPPPMRLGRPTYVLMNQSQIGSRSGGSSASKIVIAYSRSASGTKASEVIIFDWSSKFASFL